MLFRRTNGGRFGMEDWKKVEKRTEIGETPEGGVTNIDVDPDSSTAMHDDDTEDEERETGVHDLADDRADAQR
jgi:hypothetical protein